MSQVSEFFKPETFFSRENPFLKSAEKTHRLVFESYDKTARLQLAMAEDLLDLNRERYEAFYTCRSLSDLLTAQQNLVAELGERTARYAGDLKDVVTDIQAGAAEAANEFGSAAKPAKASARSKKTA